MVPLMATYAKSNRKRCEQSRKILVMIQPGQAPGTVGSGLRIW